MHLDALDDVAVVESVGKSGHVDLLTARRAAATQRMQVVWNLEDDTALRDDLSRW